MTSYRSLPADTYSAIFNHAVVICRNIGRSDYMNFRVINVSVRTYNSGRNIFVTFIVLLLGNGSTSSGLYCEARGNCFMSPYQQHEFSKLLTEIYKERDMNQ